MTSISQRYDMSGAKLKLPAYRVAEARQSEASTLPRRFAYIDYRLIGTHELPRLINTKLVYDSMLEQGYRGPAISVFYAFSDRDLPKILNNGLLQLPYGALGVADGHNRLEAFRLLDRHGRLSTPNIPIQLVPAHDPNLVCRINIYDPDEMPLPLSVVEHCFADPDSVIPTINSRFAAKLGDGSWVRIRDAQPDIIIKKSILLG